MHRKLVRLAFAALVVAAALGAGTSAASAPPPPPPNGETVNAFWENLTSLVGNKAEYGSIDISYEPAVQRLNWSLDYKGTTGPATAVRLRMRTAKGILSFALCNRCVSQSRRSKSGPYYHLHGSIVRPQRDLLLIALEQVSGDVILATASYPKGELRAAYQAQTSTGGSNGHCC